MRSPFTGVVFALELTRAWDALPALIVASVTAYAVSVLMLKRSVLTEKIARRGLHLTREYSVDPLEVFSRVGGDLPSPPDAAGVCVYADHTLRQVANIFARSGVTQCGGGGQSRQGTGPWRDNPRSAAARQAAGCARGGASRAGAAPASAAPAWLGGRTEAVTGGSRGAPSPLAGDPAAIT